MDENLVGSYKTIAGELAISLTEDQHKYILRQLEKLQDDTREIDIEFQRQPHLNLDFSDSVGLGSSTHRRRRRRRRRHSLACRCPNCSPE